MRDFGTEHVYMPIYGKTAHQVLQQVDVENQQTTQERSIRTLIQYGGTPYKGTYRTGNAITESLRRQTRRLSRFLMDTSQEKLAIETVVICIKELPARTAQFVAFTYYLSKALPQFPQQLYKALSVEFHRSLGSNAMLPLKNILRFLVLSMHTPMLEPQPIIKQLQILLDYVKGPKKAMPLSAPLEQRTREVLVRDAYARVLLDACLWGAPVLLVAAPREFGAMLAVLYAYVQQRAKLQPLADAVPTLPPPSHWSLRSYLSEQGLQDVEALLQNAKELEPTQEAAAPKESTEPSAKRQRVEASPGKGGSAAADRDDNANDDGDDEVDFGGGDDEDEKLGSDGEGDNKGNAKRKPAKAKSNDSDEDNDDDDENANGDEGGRSVKTTMYRSPSAIADDARLLVERWSAQSGDDIMVPSTATTVAALPLSPQEAPTVLNMGRLYDATVEGEEEGAEASTLTPDAIFQLWSALVSRLQSSSPPPREKSPKRAPETTSDERLEGESGDEAEDREGREEAEQKTTEDAPTILLWAPRGGVMDRLQWVLSATVLAAASAEAGSTMGDGAGVSWEPLDINPLQSTAPVGIQRPHETIFGPGGISSTALNAKLGFNELTPHDCWCLRDIIGDSLLTHAPFHVGAALEVVCTGEDLGVLLRPRGKQAMRGVSVLSDGAVKATALFGVAVETSLTQAATQQRASNPVAFYSSFVLSLATHSEEVFPLPVLASRVCVKRIKMLQASAMQRLLRLFSLYINNLMWSWPTWAEWSAALSLSDDNPQKRFVVDLFQRMLRLVGPQHRLQVYYRCPKDMRSIVPPAFVATSALLDAPDIQETLDVAAKAGADIRRQKKANEEAKDAEGKTGKDKKKEGGTEEEGEGPAEEEAEMEESDDNGVGANAREERNGLWRLQLYSFNEDILDALKAFAAAMWEKLKAKEECPAMEEWLRGGASDDVPEEQHPALFLHTLLFHARANTRNARILIERYRPLLVRWAGLTDFAAAKEPLQRILVSCGVGYIRGFNRPPAPLPFPAAVASSVAAGAGGQPWYIGNAAVQRQFIGVVFDLWRKNGAIALQILQILFEFGVVSPVNVPQALFPTTDAEALAELCLSSDVWDCLGRCVGDVQLQLIEASRAYDLVQAQMIGDGGDLKPSQQTKSSKPVAASEKDEGKAEETQQSRKRRRGDDDSDEEEEEEKEGGGGSAEPEPEVVGERMLSLSDEQYDEYKRVSHQALQVALREWADLWAHIIEAVLQSMDTIRKAGNLPTARRQRLLREFASLFSSLMMSNLSGLEKHWGAVISTVETASLWKDGKAKLQLHGSAFPAPPSLLPTVKAAMRSDEPEVFTGDSNDLESWQALVVWSVLVAGHDARPMLYGKVPPTLQRDQVALEH